MTFMTSPLCGCAGSAASATLSNAAFGLQAGSAGTTFELSGGSLALQIAGLASVSAQSARVQYAGAGAGVDAGQVLEVGGIEYQFSEAIAAGTVAFAVQGLSAQVADFVTLSGDLGLSKVGGELVAVGRAMSAQLQGLRFVGVPLTADFDLDTPAMLAAIREHRPALTYIAYPNNPTANLWDDAAIFVAPDDEAGFAGAIERLVGDAALRRALIARLARPAFRSVAEVAPQAW